MKTQLPPLAGARGALLDKLTAEFGASVSADAPTLTNLGATLDNEGRHEDALTCYQAAIAHDGTLAITHYNMGNTLKNLGRPEEAQRAYEQALLLNPHFPEAHHNLAIIHQERGDLATAHRHIQSALEQRPDFPDALHTLGELFHAEEHFDEAIAAFRSALKTNPTARTWNSLGITYQSAEHDQMAEECYRQALACDPDHIHALNNLGAVCLSLGRPEEGIGHLRKLIGQVPDYADGHWNLACCLLACGRYREGWREYEWRRLKNSPIEERHQHLPPWDGTPLAGRSILLWCEQGFGDTFQFIRYAALVAEQGGEVFVECQTPAIRSMIERAAGVRRVIVRDEPVPPVDCQASLLSLPLLVGTTLENIPSSVPYLTVPAEHQERWTRLINSGGKLRVGLVWGGRQTLRNRRRSCRLADFAPLASLEGVAWYSLQVGEQAHEAASPPTGMRLRDLTPHIRDFSDTAALINCLDMVITIDTSVAHLAGALGKPVMLLLPVAADWRWLTERSDSPWYPTVRLFRQQNTGDWDDVILSLARELEAILWGQESPEAATCMEEGDQRREAEAWKEAYQCYLTALAHNPLHPCGHLRAGACLIFLNRPGEAEGYLRRAIELAPEDQDAHVNLAIALLATGNQREGWKEFEWRRRYITEPFPPIPELPPLKAGDRLEGSTILVHMEQGFGDMVQFIRHIPVLSGLGGRVILSAPRELERLFRSCPGVAQVVPHGAPLPAAHYQTLLMSLPHLLGDVTRPAPAVPPYLTPPQELVEEWRLRLEGLEGMKVGLAWQGRNMQKSGYRRALTPELLAPLLAVPGVTFVTLQPGELPPELAARNSVYDAAPFIGDFADTAALVVNLDVVISVDTAVAHLAGALGHPCWVALLFAPDWRWFPLDKGDTPWYPSLRLFRQKSPGDWPGVVNNLADALKGEALLLRAHAMGRAGRRQEAIELFREASAVPAIAHVALLNLGVYLHAVGRTTEGRDTLLRLVETNPAYTEAWQNLGLLHQALGDVSDAYVCFRRALTLRPDYPSARWNLGLLQLLLGQYHEGFKNLEARFHKLDAIPRRHTDLPRWQGEEITGKSLLVHAEQGYGDTIQFLRYIPMLAERGILVHVEVQDESLRELAQSVQGIQGVIVRGEPRPGVDLQIPLLSLPFACGTTLETIPPAPWCTPCPDKIAEWRRLVANGDALKIGIVWRGRPAPDHRRSIPERCLGPLFTIPGIRWFSLQVDEDESRPAAPPVQRGHLGRLASFSDTAACIAALDLVVTIDTAVAHLAGTIGKRTLLLLPFAPDWRWMLGRNDSPWYSAMTLFRQRQPEEWDEPISELAAVLRNMVCE
ncbi:MAG TPA: tetratricopeptide repeat protein [Geobacteraceae bacterium]